MNTKFGINCFKKSKLRKKEIVKDTTVGIDIVTNEASKSIKAATKVEEIKIETKALNSHPEPKQQGKEDSSVTNKVDL